MNNRPGPRSTPVIRPFTPAEWPAWVELDQEAFVEDTWTERTDRFEALMEFDRTLGAFDGDRMIGSAAGYSLSMTVPGGPRPVCGVTAVSVAPDHRRRGILTALMRRQLDDLREGGEAVAVLYAAEAGIYRRFGYGRAADAVTFDIPKRGAALLPNAPADPSLRLHVVRPAAVRDELVKLFDAVRPGRPGLYARTPARWDHVLADEEPRRQGYTTLRCVLAEDDAGVRGYALFRFRPGVTAHDLPDGELSLRELFAMDPAAYALLWRHLLERDLCAVVRASSRPVDDPIIHLLADPRLLTPGLMDELWVRLVDVGRALPDRAYSAPVDVVIEVTDPFCPWNEGRWRLSADGSGAVCARTGDPADLRLPVDALGAAYLGGRSLGEYQTAGLLEESRPGAVRALSAALSWPVRPWGGLVF
ncbi:UPF0256 protein [Sphaerisporangium rufum]|uniref:UPF0256 protein n=1 Tax=Sphaerisporangium rufum TaxID=1381558 RepID=A0A919V0Q7_9ACTN|nr:GNAT family N-acetyltransferase [Sphaerisporangium rufum]GII78989.1 UPF0256 protein [Sphaerisporangium rufum]